MKKILFLLAALPILLFTACSDDDDEKESSINSYESALVGVWVEDSDYIQELFHLQLDSDLTGYSWVTVYGVNELGKSAFTWSATATTITSIETSGEINISSYSLVNGVLTIVSDGETFVYIRE